MATMDIVVYVGHYPLEREQTLLLGNSNSPRQQPLLKKKINKYVILGFVLEQSEALYFTFIYSPPPQFCIKHTNKYTKTTRQIHAEVT